MKHEVAERWVTALRSGDYKQGKTRLYDARKGTFCCLGVLRDIAIWDGASCDFVNDCDMTLSKQVISWAGMASSTGDLSETSLTMMNDVLGYSFENIAGVIEKEWENL